MPELKLTNVLWVHSFPETVLNSGVFMHEFMYQAHHRKEFAARFNVHPKSMLMTGGWVNLVKQAVRLRALARDYDIVHVQWGSLLSIMCALALFKLPDTHLVLTLRGSDFYRLKHGKYRTRIHSFFASLFGRLATNFYETVIVMSDRMLADLEKSKLFLRRNKRLFVLTDPIDFKQYQCENTLNKFEATDSASHPPIRVLFSAIDPESEIKRRSMALKAVAMLRNKLEGRPVELVEMSAVPHAEVPQILRSVDVVLLTSVHEGWPNIIKEALASGVPFVSTDVSDLAAVANKTEGLCKVVSGSSDDQLVKNLGEALFSVVRSPTTDAEKQLLRSSVSQYDYEIVLKQLVEIYETDVNAQ